MFKIVQHEESLVNFSCVSLEEESKQRDSTRRILTVVQVIS